MSSTSDWNPLGNAFFRKFELYNLQGMIQDDLSKFTVCAAPYSGPIAIYDGAKVVKVGTSKPVILILSASGGHIGTVRWNSGNLLRVGWSCCEDLVCVQDDGSVLVYDLFGNFKKTFTMGQEAKDVKIIDCKIFTSFNGTTTGIAVLTTSYRLFLVNNIDDPRIRRFPEIQGIDAPPGCWAIININTSLQSKALVAKEADLYLLDYAGQCDKQTLVTSGAVEAYIEMSVSVNNKHLALFGSNGILWIGSSDLQKTYCEFDTKCYTRPLQLAWCGNGAVVCYWEGVLLLVGPNKDWIKYSYDSAVTLVPEIDGLRIISSSSHELLLRVPGVLEDIFKIGSMSPGAMLYEALREFQKGSQRADEYIRMIKDKLDLAIKQCVQAAGEEFEPSKQKLLLRAASFGKCFLTNFNTSEFVLMCQKLRVLTALRSPTVALYLTFAQFERLTTSVVIDKLILRRKYWIALAICQYLKVPVSEGSSKILAHWACYKVQNSTADDETIAQVITNKLNNAPGVSFSEIASHALKCGKIELAIKLLYSEPKASEQVPLLIKMKKDSLALTKAIESGDTDLVYMVLLYLKNKMQLGEFLMAIRTAEGAYSLYLQYCREQNPKLLLDLHYQEDNHLEEANCRIAESYEEERADARLNVLTSAQEEFTKAKNECAAKLTDEQVRLMRYQFRLEEEFKKSFLDLSLHETVYELILNNNVKLVEQLRKEFHIPDRRFWWLKILALADKGDWAELERFSKGKKSPVGYEPFVDACVRYNNHSEAEKYLTKVAPEHLVKCYIKLGRLEQATDHAFQNKSVDDLNLILAKCVLTNKSLAERINALKNQLAAKP